MDERASYNGYALSKQLAGRIFLDDLDMAAAFPKYFQIGTVNYCNAKCSMCPHRYDEKDFRGVYMSDALYGKILDELEAHSDWIESVALYWLGEPLLDRDLVHRVRALREIGIKNVQISTNAAALDADICEQLFNAGLTDLRISLDAMTKEVYEGIRCGLRYETVMGNVHDAIRIRDEKYPGRPIRLRFVQQDSNREEWDPFKRYWESRVNMELDQVQCIPCSTKEEWTTASEAAGNEYADAPCISLFSTMIIDSDGGVPLCCRDAQREAILGDVRQDTIARIWNGKKLHDIRIAHLQHGRKGWRICRNCDCWGSSWKS